ncbi:hypothetical protein [Saccharopolyspora shandongensis]|uniref:hypothetical protein n=1 Tax=Saccharopolyspora shandongensis TaxID=418495 RepID=UPI0033FBD60C
MRKFVRVLFAGAGAVGLLAMGASPALAAKGSGNGGSEDHSVVTAASQGGDGGNGGNGGNGVNTCDPAIAVSVPAKADCSTGNGGKASGGDAKATAEDDSKDRKHSKDD